MGENPELIAMARRIADHIVPERVTNGQQWRTIVERNDHALAERSALAAIIETQERDAALAEDRYLETDWQEPGQHIAAAIRSGQHYGKGHPHA